MISKRGQVTIFIIIAIIIVVGVAVFFIFRGSLTIAQIPASLEPVYTSFLSCLEEDASVGIDLLESQAGYISLPDFEPGSREMPFSSQLNFLGNPVPYWYYVSGNNVQKEQIPSKTNMQTELEEFINQKIRGCVLDSYYDDGFEILLGEPNANVIIRDNNVDVDLDMDLSISRADDTALVRNHKVSVDSRLGKLYTSAMKVYNYEQNSLFLENYAVDILRLYVPVDGVELTCSPMVWNADDIFDELQEAVEANTLALKVKGGDYSLRNEENKYFVTDVSVDSEVRFINSKEWSNSFEVAPSEENLLLANPVGNQPGLGILGFCYIPYHFVYNAKYPVLIQVYEGDEIFQFPVAVVVQGNKPREPLDANAGQIDSPELCSYRNTPVQVNTYDTNLNHVDADISYECFGEVCNIGNTEQGTLSGQFPQCVNGYVVANADGFEEAKSLKSTTNSGVVDIILDRVYEKNVVLKLDGVDYDDEALIYFISDGSSKTVVYPEQKTVELSEGQYEIQVYIYENSNLRFKETVYEQCVDIPQTGVGGIFGLTRQKCFDTEIPAQIISNVLSGGGSKNYFMLESELQGSNTIEIDAESLELPKTIEDLQDNYLLFEDKNLGVVFR